MIKKNFFMLFIILSVLFFAIPDKINSITYQKYKENEARKKKNPNHDPIERNRRIDLIKEYNEKHVENPYLGYPLTPASVSLTFQLQQQKKSITKLEKEIAVCQSQLNGVKNTKVTNSAIKKAKEKILKERIGRLQASKQKEVARAAGKRTEILREHEKYLENMELPAWVYQQEPGQDMWVESDVEPNSGYSGQLIKTRIINSYSLRQIYKKLKAVSKSSN